MKTHNLNLPESKKKITWKVQSEKLHKSAELSYQHSTHSFKRSRQRNISDKDISLAIEYGEAYFKQGMIFYVIGENSIPRYLNLKHRPKNIVIIVSGNSNCLITCYRSKNPFKHIKKKQNHLTNRRIDLAA
ncbi:protein of unknown function [Kriegella aquimaris]|uniref:DUF4258 domain-containing protein n=1 Tax=Kriegella aquimaris TaxID=192904 RepID=A0A1G9LCR5_9FLAO|nr:protein of unknown function [Kriegella aquimaris]